MSGIRFGHPYFFIARPPCWLGQLPSLHDAALFYFYLIIVINHHHHHHHIIIINNLGCTFYCYCLVVNDVGE